MVTEQRRRDWLVRTPKWAILGGFWLTQGVSLYLVQALLYVSQSQVDGYPEPPPVGSGIVVLRVTPHVFGEWPSWEDYARLLTMPDFIAWMLGSIAVLTLAQALFVLPVRRPGVSDARGKGLRSSLCVAGIVIGGLALAAVMAVAGVLEEYDLADEDLIDWIPGSPWTVMAVVLGAGWAAATPLLLAFVRGGRKETVLARLARKLLIGTVIETALLIPLDVMVRRKTSCYCWAGTYWGLTVCGAIGVFALGPAVFLPLLARRRATWYGGHCGVCGYDMSGDMRAARCPECGTGWRA